MDPTNPLSGPFIGQVLDIFYYVFENGRPKINTYHNLEQLMVLNSTDAQKIYNAKTSKEREDIYNYLLKVNGENWFPNIDRFLGMSLDPN
jgi:hypothetical protein